ncbi:MAG TPA: flavodoxin family protein [Mycobacteriales bacterium]
MPRLLVVHHTPSPALQELLEAALDGTRAEGLGAVEVVVRPALTCSPVEVLECDGVVLGTPANIGYMSGALKHFFDQAYYPVLEAKKGIPYGLYVHGNLDAAGAVAAVEKITKGLGWSKATDVVTVSGAPSKHDREAVWNLAATVAASL